MTHMITLDRDCDQVSGLSIVASSFYEAFVTTNVVELVKEVQEVARVSARVRRSN